MTERSNGQFSSGERLQASAEYFGVSIRNKLLDFVMSALPDWKCTDKQAASIVCEFQDTGSAI
jgi:hypothetical protein